MGENTGNTFVNTVSVDAATMKEVREVVEILARKEIPENPEGNAGAYSIRHDEIRRARALLAKLEGK